MLDPASPYVAYCPPGALEDARETLDRGDHVYSAIYEHQILMDSEQIILIDTTPIELPKLTFLENWYTAAALEHRLSAPLIIPRLDYPCCPLIRSTD